MLATEAPFPQYFDIDGSPLDAGLIYFGVAGQNPETNPATVYWDSAGTQPAAQPVQTLNGYTVRNGTPALVYASSDYSLTVRNRRGALIYYAQSSAAFGNAFVLSQLATNLALPAGSSLVGTVAAGAGSVGRTQQDKNRDFVDAKDYGATTAADSRAAIQLALNSGAAEVRCHEDYPVSGYLVVPAGVRLVAVGRLGGIHATQAVTAYVPFGSAHQGQLVLLAGDGARVENMRINGGNFVAGGVAIAGTSDNRVFDCTITNCGNSQAVLATGSINLFVGFNFAQYAQHGFQFWQTNGGTVTTNIARCVDGGGFWTADTANMQITGNVAMHCGDVGLDLEGGINNSIIGNVAYACNNGEIAWFNNGTGSGRVPLNNTISGNVAYRLASYQAQVAGVETPTATNGTFAGLTIFTITAGQQGITFKGNTVYATSRTALFTNDLGPSFCGIQFEGNTFVSDSLLHNVQRAFGIQGINNTFRGIGATVAAAQNQLKNPGNGLWDLNTYEYDTPKNTLAALYYFTDAGAQPAWSSGTSYVPGNWAYSGGLYYQCVTANINSVPPNANWVAVSASPTISREKFRNCGAFAFKHDPSVSFIPAVVMENEFSEGYVSNGGVECTANGYPIYKNQRLYVLINDGTATPSKDLATLTAVDNPSGQITSKMMLQVWSGGARGATYELIYIYTSSIFSRDGSGASSGIVPNASRYATFTASTIALTGPSAGTSGFLTMTVDSMQ